MSTKKLEIVVPPREPHFVGDGFRVHNFIPHAFRMDMERMDPFIVLDYNSAYYFSPSDIPRGVDVHPHRGFETVTIAYQGKVAHKDSSGGGGIISEGDVQWMTAGSGVLHKEFHEDNFSQQGGIFQMVQLWVNLPSQDKMTPPKYQALNNQDIPKHILSDNQGLIEIIAGEYADHTGAATTFSPVHLMNAKLNKHGKAHFSFPDAYNTGALVIQGSIKINDDQVVPTDHFGLFENNGQDFTIEALEENTIVLILSGKPLNEPIVAHGPFVMNTPEQIIEALRDYNFGKFGHLE